MEREIRLALAIRQVILHYFNVPVRLVNGDRRSKYDNIAYAKAFTRFFIRLKIPNMTLAEIGKLSGNVKHSSVSVSINATKVLIESDIDYAEWFRVLSNLIDSNERILELGDEINNELLAKTKVQLIEELEVETREIINKHQENIGKFNEIIENIQNLIILARGKLYD